jgi:hypothetical protein
LGRFDNARGFPVRETSSNPKTIETMGWFSLGLAIGGSLGSALLIVFGAFYGVFVESRTSGDGPNWIVYVGLFGSPLLELCAVGCGVASWRTRMAKVGMLVSVAALAFYFGVWPGTSMLENLAMLTEMRSPGSVGQ